jgi:hypothetical protein
LPEHGLEDKKALVIEALSLSFEFSSHNTFSQASCFKITFLQIIISAFDYYNAGHHPFFAATIDSCSGAASAQGQPYATGSIMLQSEWQATTQHLRGDYDCCACQYDRLELHKS